MSMTDPIADLLTRIRNAQVAKHKTVDVPASRMKVAIVTILSTPKGVLTGKSCRRLGVGGEILCNVW